MLTTAHTLGAVPKNCAAPRSHGQAAGWPGIVLRAGWAETDFAQALEEEAQLLRTARLQHLGLHRAGRLDEVPAIDRAPNA